MDSTVITQGFADPLFDTVLRQALLIDGEQCPICKVDYISQTDTETMDVDTNVASKASSLYLLSELPFSVDLLLSAQEPEPVSMPCGHHFCLSCMCRWLFSQNTCPMCRNEVEVPNLQYTNPDPFIALMDSDNGNQVQLDSLIENYGVPPAAAVEATHLASTTTREVLTTLPPDDAYFNFQSGWLKSDLKYIMLVLSKRWCCQEVGLPHQKDPHLLPRNPLSVSIHEWPHPLLSSLGRCILYKSLPKSETTYGTILHGILIKIIDEFEEALIRERTFEVNVNKAVQLILIEVGRKWWASNVGYINWTQWRAFVKCVVEYLIRWQWYCDRVEEVLGEDFVDTRRRYHGLGTPTMEEFL